MQAETHYHFRYMPRDKNIIQLTQSQLDRFARNVGYAIAKEIINSEIKPDDDRVYNITQKGAARMIGADVSLIRQMRQEGQIQGKLIGHRIYYCEQELKPFIKK